MDDNKKKHFKELLQRRKDFEEIAMENIADLNLSGNVRETIGELSAYDNHPADIATELFQLEHALGMKAMHEDSAKKVEDAMIRLESDQFGICQECSKPIDEERLEILPESKLCIECARKKDIAIKTAQEAIRFRPPGYNEVMTEFGTKPVRDPLEGRDTGKDVLDDLMKFGSAEAPSEEGNYKDFNEFYNTQRSEDGIVDEVDKISNEQYIEQIPD